MFLSLPRLNFGYRGTETKQKAGGSENVSVEKRGGKGKKACRKRPKCEYIDFTDPERKKSQKFKLFKEDDFDSPLREFMKADTRPEEPQYDDDFLTDDEQIKSSIDLINKDIEAVLKEYFKQKKETSKNTNKKGKEKCEKNLAKKKKR